MESLREVYAEIAARAGFVQRLQAVKVDRDIFRKVALPAPANAKPDQAPVIGYELECKGDSAYHVFSGEGGVWRIGEDEKKPLNLFVAVSQCALEEHVTPPAVHRKNFFEGLPIMRQVKQGAVSDVNDGWRCPYPFAVALHPMLTARWRRLLDDILTGEDLA